MCVSLHLADTDCFSFAFSVNDEKELKADYITATFLKERTLKSHNHEFCQSYLDRFK